jgi:hypothetical protein
VTQPSATAHVEVAAPAAVVYGLITDLDTFAELADETARMAWRNGATTAASGARFRGTNRNGWRRWSTECTVTDADPGTRFAFEVRFPPRIPVARWQYDIAALDDGTCRVTESTWDRRPAWFRLPAELGTGVRNRAETNLVHIEHTLQRLKQHAESLSS